MILGYVCKYTPAELLTALGAKTERINPSVSSFNRADAMMHPNMCSYAKSVLEWMAVHEDDCEGIVFTTCCDSIRRLFDIAKTAYPGKFFYLLDIPRKTDDTAVALYAERILALAEAYSEFRGMHSPSAEEKLHEILEQQRRKAEEAAEAEKPGDLSGTVRIGLIGARMPGMLSSILEENNAKVVFDLSCTGQDRAAALGSPSNPEPEYCCSGSACGNLRYGSPEFKEEFPHVTPLLFGYAKALLMQLPCLRMADASERLTRLTVLEENADGIIDHTVKFCDSYSYEYARIHRQSGIPILKIETDLTKQCEGQIRTRVEAFIESLQSKKNRFPDKNQNLETAGPRRMPLSETGTCADTERWKAPGSENPAEKAAAAGKGTKDRMRFGRKVNKENAEKSEPLKASDSGVLVCGIDSGSTSTNAVILDENKKILASVILRTGAKSGVSADKALAEALADAGRKLGRNLSREDIKEVVSTGYGRVSISFADRNVTEISCHARGARFFDPNVRTILDIGGQDSKAIRLNADGSVADFVMNDKCAAGTGRFLEAMARTLEVDIDDLGPISMESRENVEISSMCTVFAESEVISLIAQNKEKADIARGVHNAIAGKAVSLMKRVGMEPEYMMTGGVARNPGVVKAIEELIGAKLFICDVPDIVGAVGAALYALDEC